MEEMPSIFEAKGVIASVTRIFFVCDTQHAVRH